MGSPKGSNSDVWKNACMDILRVDPNAISNIREQTEEICLAAVLQQSEAIKYIKDEQLRAKLQLMFM